MTSLKLDRIALDDVGANPQRLAQAIHAQIGEAPGPVPICEIATALDIVTIREEPLTNIEGALVAPPERGYGAILVNARSKPQRRRFTIGHELGHFLNPWHRPSTPDGFRCARADMVITSVTGQNRQLRQEAEANAFAIELLAPSKWVRRYIAAKIDLAQVLAMAEALEISREAAARRYVELHDQPLAVVFSRHFRFLYCERGTSFPPLSLRKNCDLPDLPQMRGNSPLSEVEYAEPQDWLMHPAGIELSAQTLYQQGDYAMTLLRADLPDDEDTPSIDDTVERFQMISRG